MVTGQSYVSGDLYLHAFLYRDGGMEDLGTLGCCDSVGNDINERGDVAGQTSAPESTVAHPVNHAFLYSDGVMRDLGTLGGVYSVGYAVNENRNVTGTSSTDQPNEFHAFLYAHGVMHDLNDLVSSSDPLALDVTLLDGVDINDHGVIVANGYNAKTGNYTVYLLTPIKQGGGGSTGGAGDWPARPARRREPGPATTHCVCPRGVAPPSAAPAPTSASAPPAASTRNKDAAPASRGCGTRN